MSHSLAPVLLVGGSGVVGLHTAKSFRAASPDVPLLIGGRNLEKARAVAKEVGNAQGVVLDLAAENLGLGELAVSAVAVLIRDDTLAGLRFAQKRGVPHISITLGASEIAPEVAAYIQNPNAAPIVLGAEWLVGATTIPTLELVKKFRRVDSITISALLDEQDSGGPTTESDMKSLNEDMPAALVRRDGAFVWLQGEEAKTQFHTIDGTQTQATAFSPYDVMGLAAVTDAPNVRFNLSIGVSSTRRRGEPASTEILIELAGESREGEGQPLRTRHAVFHSQGQMPLTGLGIAMVLGRVLGLDGQPPTPAGLYFPYQLLESATYLARFKQSGAMILELEAT